MEPCDASCGQKPFDHHVAKHLWQSGILVVAESVVLRGSIDKKPDSDEANLIVNEIIPYAQRCFTVYIGGSNPAR